MLAKGIVLAGEPAPPKYRDPGFSETRTSEYLY